MLLYKNLVNLLQNYNIISLVWTNLEKICTGHTLAEQLQYSDIDFLVGSATKKTEGCPLPVDDEYSLFNSVCHARCKRKPGDKMAAF